MGYYVSLIEATDEVRIPNNRIDDLVAMVEAYEAIHNTHISWCDLVSEYRKRGLDNRQIVIEVMFGFGFIVNEDEDDYIGLSSWGGDKMGMAWEAVWDALGAVADRPATWFIAGEDSTLWFEEVDGAGNHITGGVSLVKDIKETVTNVTV